KRAGRDVLHWHLDNAIEIAIGAHPDDASTPKTAVPDIALGIDCTPEHRQNRRLFPRLPGTRRRKAMDADLCQQDLIVLTTRRRSCHSRPGGDAEARSRLPIAASSR